MQGVLIFGLGGLVLVGAFVVMIGRRREYQATGAPEDVLTDEEFRRIEYGDDAP
ncbi:MAG: hypothetical protein ACKOYM_05870 [Actinomycetes bacterium]